MTHDDYFNMLNNAEDLPTQIQFCETLSQKWRENDDSKMANMYKELSDSLTELKKLKLKEAGATG